MANGNAVQPKTVTVELPDGSKQTVPLFGPYGDVKVHGSKLVTKVKQSDPKKRKAEDTLTRTYKHSNGIEYWAAQCYVPANDAECLRYAQSKPANVRAHIEDALCVDAGQASWHENRGGNSTLWVVVNGSAPQRAAVELVAAMRKAGMTVTEVSKPAPKQKSK